MENLSAAKASLISCYKSVGIVKLGLITEKGKLLRTSLDLIPHSDQLLSLLLCLIVKNAPSNIYILGNLKCTMMYK